MKSLCYCKKTNIKGNKIIPLQYALIHEHGYLSVNSYAFMFFSNY